MNKKEGASCITTHLLFFNLSFINIRYEENTIHFDRVSFTHLLFFM